MYSGINQNIYQNPYLRQQNNINWVQGPEGAKAYQLAPNSNIVLMDSESDKFYIKSCDNVGMCTLKAYTYTEDIPVPKEEYVTKSELAEVLNKYEQLISRIDKQSNSKSIQQSSNSTGNEYNKR